MSGDDDEMKQNTSSMLELIGQRFPKAKIVLININEKTGTADVAFALDLLPSTVARTMREIGSDLCAALQIPPETSEDN
jgi:hypothetical protein